MTNSQEDGRRSDAGRPSLLAEGARADLHIHSKYSNRPSEWFLRRIGAPESFVEPRALYDACRLAGMDYVTISDHNCIDGALEIADLPGTFLSTELTTYFPEDRCKIHCLASGITPAQFAELMQVRENIYDLRDYLVGNQIIHTIVHPLFRVNDKLTAIHVEKLIVLFNRFERLNGTRSPLAARVAEAIFDHLTPEDIQALANRHGLAPIGPTPWIKHLTGGSDDHGGLYGAAAYTQTPPAPTVDAFLEHLRLGNHQPGGKSGCSIKLADSLLTIACEYYRHRLLANSGDRSLLGDMLTKLASHPTPAASESRARGMARKLLTPLLKRRRYRQLPELERQLLDEISHAAQEGLLADGEHRQPGAYEARFATAAGLAHRLGYAFLNQCSAQFQKGSLVGGLQAIASLVPVGLGLAPYVTAFSTQHKDDPFLRSLLANGNHSTATPQPRKAWLTDTFDDVNGVAKTVRTLATLARDSGMPMTVVTCLRHDPVSDCPVRNFPPVGMFSLPDYPSQQVAFPPFMDMLAWLEEAGIEELLISTPGPVGLVGIAAARLLGIPARGIYHTDFPRYVEQWTEDPSMGEMAKRFMRWFYGKMDRIYAPTQAYVDELVNLGFAADIIDVLPRGVNTDTFNPAHRQADFWKRYKLNGGYKFVYVGRLSREKNIDVLLDAHRLLGDQGVVADLAVVGDGPELERLKQAHARPNVAFTGYLHGDSLASAYASSDALVFPSMTDTFGNVVLEAHASGLPAIVSDCGGPQEIVRANDSGLVVDARRPETLAAAMHALVGNPDQHRQYRRRAIETAHASRWEDVLKKL